MTVFAGAVDATFAAFGIDASYTPTGGDPIPVRVIARRPDTIVGFGETRIHADTATFEVRANDVASPRPDDQLTIGGETFVVQGDTTPLQRGDKRGRHGPLLACAVEPFLGYQTGKPQPDSTLVKALARAWRWQRMLDEGASVNEIGDAENISKSYVSRILRLALLAPDIVEAILEERADQALI